MSCISFYTGMQSCISRHHHQHQPTKAKMTRQSWSQHITAASRYQTLQIYRLNCQLSKLPNFGCKFHPWKCTGCCAFNNGRQKSVVKSQFWKWVICKVKLPGSPLWVVIQFKYQGKGIGVDHSVTFLFGDKQAGIFDLTVQSLFFPDGHASKDGYLLPLR